MEVIDSSPKIGLLFCVAEHRGDRMACTPIMRKYRHKAVAREWFGNGAPASVSGRLEFVQDEGDASHSLVDLDGLGGQANSYHIHVVPVQPQLEFPCTGDAIGVHFAPFDEISRFVGSEAKKSMQITCTLELLVPVSRFTTKIPNF